MFGSLMLYVVFAAAVALLLVVVCWPKEKQEKSAQQMKKRTNEMGVRIPRFTEFVGVDGAILDVKEVPHETQRCDGQCVELPGVLDFNEGVYQRCASCMESWYGDPILSKTCPRCGSELVTVKSARSHSAHLRVSRERLERLLQKIDQRIRERARWASSHAS